MSLVTIGLTGAVIVVGLVLLLLEWGKTEKKAPIPLHANTAVSARSLIGADSQENIPLLQAQIKAVEQKTQLAHERLQRLEKIVGQIPLESVEKNLDLKALEQKIERLIEFKNEIRIQVAALEEALEKGKEKIPKIEAHQLDELEKELKEQNQSLKKLEAKIPILAFNHSKKRK